jgi:BirA family biotin operon repressor/biotin-[acetyl-CoA-carboxylase] ligase
MNSNSIAFIENKLVGKSIGHKVYYYPEIGSTNDEAYRLVVAGAEEGSVVIAESQTKGKGRHARSWHSPAGLNIYTSVILRPPIAPSAAPQLSIVAGVAIVEELERYCPGQVKLKWPNDIPRR